MHGTGNLHKDILTTEQVTGRAQSGEGRNSAPATDFSLPLWGYAKSFVSNNDKFCFLGDTEAQRGFAASGQRSAFNG
jgi:hypothetical protein